MRRRTEILVSWVSIQHAAEPLLTVFANPESELHGRIDRLVLCHRVSDEESEKKALDATLRRLERLEDEVRPELELRPWKTSAQPTDHAKLLEFAKRVLTEIRSQHPEARINLHLSPGTKAMHAAWLILAHGGFVSGPVRLLQTREERHRKDDQRPIEWVNLPQETWAHVVRAFVPSTPGEDDVGVLWDPVQVVSEAGKQTLAAVARWAPLRAPILLVGERGTGKTTLAQAIRARSGFVALGKKPWPVVVCGQFRANPELARSELFGHARGAYTGASDAREGILERVDGDTLFLDEIADLDQRTQRLLMAAIEGRGFQRLGEDRLRQANFRLLAATNRPLERLVNEARDAALGADSGLDADFFDRISTFILPIPPLRERRADLPIVWRSALTRAMAESGGRLDERGQSVVTDKAVLAALRESELPGNVRDLHRAAWHAVAVLASGGGRSEAAHAAIAGLSAFSAPTETSAETAGESPAAVDEGRQVNVWPIDLDGHLSEVERQLVEQAMAEANGNKRRAAELLGLPRKTFEYRLGRLR